MAYKTLYRKWRPTTFDEIVGQKHITETLKNEIKTNKISHAYIFTGTRGTGKTSTAKILSRAVNCTDLRDGNPCNQCPSCLGIINSVSLDVSEIDAASNNGVDNIRDIIDQVRYTTATNKYKVYIIDEVHMLSDGAFNALLKTLEEPPEHIIFILATTEIHKVFPTILSRCQRFDFKNISSADISEAIKEILSKEGINADPDAIDYVSQLGNGSMRDALSILEQCLAYRDNNLSVSDVTAILGTVDYSLLYQTASYIAQNDVRNVLGIFESCVNSGKSPENFSIGLLEVMRDLMVYKCAPGSDEFTDMKKNNLEKTVDLFTEAKLVRCIQILTELSHDITRISSSRVLTESALIRLSSPDMYVDTDSILDRLSTLENLIKNRNFISELPKQQDKVDDPVPAIDKPVNEDAVVLPKDEPSLQASVPGELSLIVSEWEKIKSEINDRGNLVVFVNLYNTHLEESDGEIVIKFCDKDSMHSINNEKSIEVIQNTIFDMYSLNVNIKCVVEEEINKTVSQNNDIFNDIAKLSNSYPENFKIE